MVDTLYYAPGTASLCVHWMLIELGIPFEAVAVDFATGQQRSAEYLRLNPSGRVPTLVTDGVAHHESTALLILLAERHSKAGLAPTPGEARRAVWLEEMIFLANTLLPAFRDWFYAGKDGDPAGADWVQALARKRIEAAWDRLEAMLADGREYLLGQQISTADFLAFMLMRWSRNMPRPALNWPHLAAYAARLRVRPSYIDVCTREGIAIWP